jgi:hypothetical protein
MLSATMTMNSWGVALPRLVHPMAEERSAAGYSSQLSNHMQGEKIFFISKKKIYNFGFYH